MPDRHIISVDPASGRGELVVVEVLQDGPSPLDVRLVACDGEDPYVTTIKQRNLARLKHKFKGSDDDWATILSHFLLQQPVGKAKILDGVRLVYTSKATGLELSFRQDVQGIKVTLGEIVLPKDDDFEFNPFEWAQASAKAHFESLQELAELKATASGEQDTIAKLNAQLDDFVKTKNEAETAMLQQFMELLNEKKRKIRDQTRLLAGAKVDPSVASAVQTTRGEKSKPKPRKAGASRQSKRKAPALKAEPDVEPDIDSDQMEFDHAKEEQDEDEVPKVTPDPSDNEANEEEAAAPPIRERSSETLRSNSQTEKEPKIDGNPPPKRALPFGRPAKRSKQREPSPPADEDDDTEDEEL